MAAPPDIRSQLHALSIPKENRPAKEALRSPPNAPRSAGRPRRIPRWITFLVGAIVVLGALAVGARQAGSLLNAPAEAAEVRLITVTDRDGARPPAVLTATGKIVSDHIVEVATKVSGQITELFFEQGDVVKVGQRLARIEDVIYRARRDEAAATLEKSKAHLEFQRVNFERVRRLHDSQNAPDIEFADARRALDEAAAQVTADEAALAFAQKALTDCEVLAPIAGVILDRAVEVGDFVAAEGGLGAMANSQFATIADMTKLRVEVDVSELDIARLRRNMPCIVTPDAYKDRHYDGFVLWIDPGADYSKATVQVKVRIRKPDAHLRVQGSAQVEFLSDAAPPAGTDEADAGRVWIPASACLGEGDSPRVFIVEERRFRSRPIEIGRRVAGQVEVIRGLSPGDQIAVDGVETIQDGQRIRG